MNQILNTKLFKKNHQNKKFFKIQFILSTIFLIILVTFLFFYFFSLKKYEKKSNNLTNNYSLYKLYSKYSKEATFENEILGIIEIPKISIKYPVFSRLDEELLKISPCRFYGKTPNEYGNLCIAGHNYNNSKFFSNLFLLNNGDSIFFYDNSKKKYIYTVFSFYEVTSSDMSPIFNYDRFSKELTLITCNNINQNRLIIKAKQQKDLE